MSEEDATRPPLNIFVVRPFECELEGIGTARVGIRGDEATFAVGRQQASRVPRRGEIVELNGWRWEVIKIVRNIKSTTFATRRLPDG